MSRFYFTVDLNINLQRGILSLMFWPFAKWSWTPRDCSAGGGDYSVLCFGPFHMEWFSHR